MKEQSVEKTGILLKIKRRKFFLTFYIVLLKHHTNGTSNLANQVGFDHVGQLNSLNDNKEIQKSIPLCLGFKVGYFFPETFSSLINSN